MAWLVLVVVVDVAVIVGVSIGVGMWAPKWPARWLRGDPFPLYLWPWETARFFRALRVPQLAQRLPELGATFGGQSKSALPGTTRQDLQGYLVEVRRAEWVHWIAIGSSILVSLWSPLWLGAILIVGVTVGNLPFILILRNNRRRLRAVLARALPPSKGNP